MPSLRKDVDEPGTGDVVGMYVGLDLLRKIGFTVDAVEVVSDIWVTTFDGAFVDFDFSVSGGRRNPFNICGRIWNYIHTNSHGSTMVNLSVNEFLMMFYIDHEAVFKHKHNGMIVDLSLKTNLANCL